MADLIEARPSCAFCDAGAALQPFALPGLPPYLACAPCVDDLIAQGRRPRGPFEPRLAALPAHAWRLPLEPDARALLARVLAAHPSPHPDPGTWSRATLPALLDDLRRRLGLAGAPAPRRPPGPEVAYALAAAVVAGEELGPWERVERIAPSDPVGELLHGVHAHHAARVRLARLQESGELPAPTWLEPEDRRAAGDLLLRAPKLGAAAARLDPVLPRVLDAARQAYQYSDALTQPPARRGADGGLGHQVALLLAALSLERGDGDAPRPAREEGSLERAERLLKEHEASGPPDPRAALLQAAVQRIKGFKDGCDRALARGIQQAGSDPRWADVLAQLQHDRYVRALDAGAWAVATDALRARRALRPDDRRSLLELAYLYYRRSMPGVAREVLEATLRRAPDEEAVGRDARDWLDAAREEIGRYGDQDPEGRLLLAACLLRLGEPRAALDALAPGLDEEAPGSAQRWRLAGLCELELGRAEPALERLAQAVARAAPSDRGAARRDLVRVVLGELRQRVVDLEARVAPLRRELEELERSAPAPDPAERAALVARLAQEVQGDPEADPLTRGADTLPGLVDVVARHGAALADELDQVGTTFGDREHPITLTSADLLGMSLLCELADPDLRGQLSRVPVFSELLSAGFGFSGLDGARGGTSMMNAFLVHRNLVARRLPEAVRCNRGVGESPVPIELLLRFLAVVRCTDETRRAALGLVAGVLLPRLARRGLIVLVPGP